MSGLAFDSLAYARRLEAAGFPREQAEALAVEQVKLVDERLATKADLEQTRASLSRDIEALRLSTETRLADTKADILRWSLGAISLQTVVIIGAVVALVRGFLH